MTNEERIAYLHKAIMSLDDADGFVQQALDANDETYELVTRIMNIADDLYEVIAALKLKDLERKAA